MIEAFKFAVDRNPQRLKRASGGVDPPLFFRSDSALYQFGEVASRANWFAAFPALNDPARNATGATLFAVLEDDARQLYFRKTTEKPCRSLAARHVHAHVERRVVPETEPPCGRVQLQRRNTEVGKNTAYLPDFRCREDPRKFTKVGVYSAKARAVKR